MRRNHLKPVSDETEKESIISERRPKARQTLGKSGKWLFLLLMMEQNWLSVSAQQKDHKEAKQSWRFAADAARFTDGRANSEDRKHPSGGVLVAVDQAVNEERIAQSRVNVRGSLCVSWCISGTQKAGPR